MPDAPKHFAPTPAPFAGTCGECGVEQEYLTVHAGQVHADGTGAYARSLGLPEDHLVKQYLEDVDRG